MFKKMVVLALLAALPIHSVAMAYSIHKSTICKGETGGGDSPDGSGDGSGDGADGGGGSDGGSGNDE